MPIRTLLALALLAPALLADHHALSETDQIRAALQAAPESRRDGAGVVGWTAEGKTKTLREAQNDLICLAAKPGAKNYSVACYHKDLDPWMARGRELSAEGLTGMDRHKARWAEVESGKLHIPREPRMLYVLHGDGFDPATGETVKPYLRWVVYTPYATPETTGLPIEASNEPWLMYPGTPGAHIMISPPRPK